MKNLLFTIVLLLTPCFMHAQEKAPVKPAPHGIKVDFTKQLTDPDGQPYCVAHCGVTPDGKPDSSPVYLTLGMVAENALNNRDHQKDLQTFGDIGTQIDVDYNLIQKIHKKSSVTITLDEAALMKRLITDLNTANFNYLDQVRGQCRRLLDASFADQ